MFLLEIVLTHKYRMHIAKSSFISNNSADAYYLAKIYFLYFNLLYADCSVFLPTPPPVSEQL